MSNYPQSGAVSYTVSVAGKATAEAENLATSQEAIETRINVILDRLSTLGARLQPVLVPRSSGEGKPEGGVPRPMMSPARSIAEGHIDGLRSVERDICDLLSRLDLP